MTSNDVTIRRGDAVPRNPAISVVVMAIHADPRVLDAINSLWDETIPTEMIVVNTGDRSLKGQLDSQLDRIVLVESPALRMPGGTRNLGIAEAHAPVVAFLAADCLATPRWLALRLHYHRAATAVASAIRPAPATDGSIRYASWASYFHLHCRRAPECPEEHALRYGVSYNRDLLHRHGPFLEDRRIAEDDEYNSRLTGNDSPLWAPELVTMHRYPERYRASCGDAYARGKNLLRFMAMSRGNALKLSLRRCAGSMIFSTRMIARTSGRTRQALTLAWPAIAFLAVCYSAGVMREAMRTRRMAAVPSPAS